jgi:hypothetical protein
MTDLHPSSKESITGRVDHKAGWRVSQEQGNHRKVKRLDNHPIGSPNRNAS